MADEDPDNSTQNTQSEIKNDPVRILLIEDSADDAELLERQFRKSDFSPETRRVESMEDLDKAITEPWSLIITDWYLEDFTGLDVIAKLKGHKLDIPVIMVSGQAGEEAAVTAMRAGASDYVLKDRLSRLVPAVERELAEARHRQEGRDARTALRHSESRFDLFMTHLPGPVSIKDQDGFYVFVNEHFQNLLAEPEEDILGKTVRDLWPPELAAKLAQDDERVRAINAAMEVVEEFELEGELVSFLTVKFPLPRPKGPPMVASIALDITLRRQAEERVRKTTEQLEVEREALKDKNIALREVMERLEVERDRVKQDLVRNVEQAVLPLILRMKQSADQSMYRNFDLLVEELREITSPFLNTLQNRFARLSPRESEVCRLIRRGMTTKEIAETLTLSPLTVQKHRELIRRKLGLTNNGANLNTFLRTIDQ
ncbi:PAS domain-containing protein [candidate division GN15 bacterium]|nr:PAS domain-containing protein [candidate division GN15 bacterium]